MNTKRIMGILLLVCVTIILSSTLTIKMSYKGPVSDLIDRCEKVVCFDITFTEVLYFKGEEPGPFGEGSDYLVVTVTEETDQLIQEYLIDEGYLFMVTEEEAFKLFLSDDTFVSTAPVQWMEGEGTFSGVYSKEKQQFLSFENISKIDKLSFEVLHRYFVLQYNTNDKKLIIRSCG